MPLKSDPINWTLAIEGDCFLSIGIQTEPVLLGGHMSGFEYQLNNTIATVEKGFNLVGYVPVASTFSGGLRMACGKIEIICSVVAAGLVLVAGLFAANQQEREKRIDQAGTVLKTYALHGLANMFRGALEMTALLGLVACLPYDLFGNRFIYPQERAGSFYGRNVYTI